MRIESIRLKNFKAFRDIELKDLPNLVVLIGANGTGKSTFFDVFKFLSDALRNNVRQALNRRGGFKEVISRKQIESKEDQGSDSEETRYIEIELKFRLKIVEKERLVTYFLKIGQRDGAPYVSHEILKYKRGAHGSPYHFLDFSEGEGDAITNEENYDKEDENLNREKQQLTSPDILAIKGLGQFERFKAANVFRTFIENWHLSDFYISEARASKDAGHAEHLSPTGDNLPLVAQYIRGTHPEIFDKILKRMEATVPGVKNIQAENTVDGRIVLRFQDGSFHDPFIARYVSDGTIKMFAYLVLLYDPAPHPLLCIEEPENQLYPYLLERLLEEIRSYTRGSTGGQVFVSTHSPDLLNAAKIEEVFWLEKKKGSTRVHLAREDERLRSLVEEEGDKLGRLWRMGMFGEMNS